MRNYPDWGDTLSARKIFRFKILMKFLLLTIMVSGITASVLADEPAIQQVVITGTVTDSQTGEPMPGVNIVMKGSTVGTITGIDGKYSLNVPDSALQYYCFK